MGDCIGHVSPEALAGGPIGKLRGDLIEIEIDRLNMVGQVNFVGSDGERFDGMEGALTLAGREQRTDLRPDPQLPGDTRLWAALQNASGGVWGGCVYDVDAIVSRLGGPH